MYNGKRCSTIIGVQGYAGNSRCYIGVQENDVQRQDVFNY